MMRLLFLCLLLMLPAAPAVSEETEGSADGGLDDDEDSVRPKDRDLHGPAEPVGGKETHDHLTLIIIIVAVVVLTLSGAAIITLLLVRRRLHNRQQGIYFVPAEQDQKGAI
ncbi:uncharacterized protein si:dkey-262k9.2 isoform X2 [Cyclopterus lumpus]|nr:uncharacterized protein si:dkey-262k9.2 isoform X2 [Cyclopterus lumpus]XP_034408916.1 uncharacterized protein si:dkey-262k9.2 isoform X2 [Cyclopterus lumpus]